MSAHMDSCSRCGKAAFPRGRGLCQSCATATGCDPWHPWQGEAVIADNRDRLVAEFQRREQMFGATA